MGVDGREFVCPAWEGVGNGGDVESGAGELEGGGRVVGRKYAGAEGSELEGLLDNDPAVQLD